MASGLEKVSGRKAVVLLSGGLDSMVVAGLAREAGYALYGLTIDYNQRHRQEIAAAEAIAARMKLARHLIMPLDLRRFGGSALTDDIAVPKGGLTDDIPVTYVPARNLIFLSLSLAWAEVVGADDIFIGVNALDYSGYPDCRPEFISAFAELGGLATKAGSTGRKIAIHAPLQFLGKAEIAREAARLGLDPAMSWSCYDPAEDGRACGFCDSCRLRRAAYIEAGITDPVTYANEIS